MNPLATIAAWLAEGRSAVGAVVFTGAGISTESGIPDFRSPGGSWATSRPVYFAEFLKSAEARHEYWRQKAASHRDFAAAAPNAGHRVLAEWERAGLIRGVITQNIDGLHQLAGSSRVLELHGTAREVACLGCARRWPADPWVARFVQEDRVPDCPVCGGLLKHAVVSFGQNLPPDVMQEAAQWVRDCELFVALGSSLVVHPAASLPETAARRGAKLAIINREETPLDSLAKCVIRSDLGPALTEIERLRSCEPGG